MVCAERNFQPRGGDGGGNGPKNEVGWTQDKNAAHGREQDEHRVEVKSVAHEDRTEQVLDQTRDKEFP
jgi:hypothetical protein